MLRGTLECEKFILEKTSWNKSLYLHENLQNELSYIEIGPQIKKLIFFISIVFIVNMRTTKRRVGSLVLKIEKNGFQILVQRENLHT